MNQLQIIDQREVLGKDFKIYGDFENPLFLAKDVAKWIEHSNSRMMLQSVDECEKLLVNNPYILTSHQKQWFLNEDGLYEVLMQSRKPIAKQFKKQVKEILKSIRKTNSCLDKPISTAQVDSLAVFEKQLKTAKIFSEITGTNINKALINSINETQRLTGEDFSSWKNLLPNNHGNTEILEWDPNDENALYNICNS
jgi:prophage antirepressor-like protein